MIESFLRRAPLLGAFLILVFAPYPGITRAQEDSLLELQDSQPETDDLSRLEIVNQIVLKVRDNYVDTKRIEPKEMVLAALDYVQRSTADVMVDGDAKTGRVTVTVGSASKDFDISDVDSIYKISLQLRQIFGFMQPYLSKTDKPRDIQYAAVAGMLSTLDPHSVFMTPDQYKEMKLTTRGEFGGLGFMIEMKESFLTVRKVFKGTPAYKSGIKARDRVLKIGEQSTVNMDLNEAVSKLRGKPETNVTITVARKEWKEPKRITLMREEIQIPSVVAKLLDGGPQPGGGNAFVGGIRLKGFQGNTYPDLMKAIASLKAEAHKKGGSLHGLVLDLRGNPGGLLDQAIQVTNAFVDHGTVVSTVMAQGREVKKAHPGPDVEKDIPLAVIIDNGSASASEIVAGALKNLNRAVIVGHPSFGKGSVQVLYDFPDETALKLTIAQYLTPGDISIQEVGIVPDIALDPARVSKDQVEVFSPRKLVGEADLEHHFGNPSVDKPSAKRSEVVPTEKPVEVVQYLNETKKPKVEAHDDLPGDEDVDEAEDDDFRDDFQVKFTRDLVLAAPVDNRTAMLEASRAYVQQVRVHEQQRIEQAIAALGIDWSTGPQEGTPRAVVDVHTQPARGEAGQTLNLITTVENTGTGPMRQLRAYTKSENPWLDRREFLFGLVKPGEKRSWTVPIKLPKDMISRRDEVTLIFQDEHGQVPQDQKTEVAVLQLPRPAFAFSTQIVPQGLGDGLARVGQEVTLSVDVKNVGQGKGLSTFAMIRNLGDEKVFIKKGREKIGEIKPGESRTVTFELELVKGFKGESIPLKLSILDNQLDEFVTEKINLPVTQAPLKSQAKKSNVRVEIGGPVLLSAAQPDSPPIATVKKGAVLASLGRVGNFWQVEWGKSGPPGSASTLRTAFLPVGQGKEVPAKPSGLPVSFEQHQPPRIQVAGLDGASPITDSDHFPLAGSVSDNRPVRDMAVFVGEKKVYFHTGGGAEAGPVLKFEKSVPLKAGNNVITIVARQDDDYSSKRQFVVMRRSPEVAAGKGEPSPPDGVAHIPPAAKPGGAVMRP
jgi:carboxyl-terminal processing protease